MWCVDCPVPSHASLLYLHLRVRRKTTAAWYASSIHHAHRNAAQCSSQLMLAALVFFPHITSHLEECGGNSCITSLSLESNCDGCADHRRPIPYPSAAVCRLPCPGFAYNSCLMQRSSVRLLLGCFGAKCGFSRMAVCLSYASDCDVWQ
jgi:hypothetical protein